MKKTDRVYIVGSLNMDVVVFTESLPKPGETVFGNSPLRFPGGKGLNQAVAVQRLGGMAEIAGSVGDDAFGNELYSFLKSEGIGIDRLHRVSGETTGTAYIFVDENSENFIVVVPGANFCDVGSFSEHFQQGDVVLSQFEIPYTSITNTFREAKAAGAFTVLNPAPFRKIDKELIQLTDLLILNEVELESFIGRKIAGHDDQNILDHSGELLSMGCGEVIVTLGKKGAVYLSDRETFCSGGYEVAAIDTTGAGDTFIGAYAASVSGGEGRRQALEFANAAAALSVMRKGASSSIPSYEEVIEFMKSSTNQQN